LQALHEQMRLRSDVAEARPGGQTLGHIHHTETFCQVYPDPN
jgi:hypothetical protein